MTAAAPAPAPDLPRRKRFRWLRALLVVLLVGVAWMCRWLIPPPALVISKETTFITQPLLPSGVPDYGAAIREEWSRGVTPENNAHIPLLQAFKPTVLPEATREKYYEQLGVPAPPGDRDYLEPLEEFIKARLPVGEPKPEPESDDIVPFTAQDRPLTAAWIEANAGPGELVLEATRRSHYFAPAVSESGSIIHGPELLEIAASTRTAARFLLQRSLLRLGSGDVDGSMNDAIACLRYGRLVAQHWSMIGLLTGNAIEGMGHRACEQLVLSGKMSSEQLIRLQAELAKLPPAADVVRMIDRGERLIGLQSLLIPPNVKDDELPQTAPALGFVSWTNLNSVLAVMNRGYDDAVQALSETDLQQRAAKLRTLQASYNQWTQPQGLNQVMAGFLLFDTRSSISARIGRALFGQVGQGIWHVHEVGDRMTAKMALLQTAVRLAQYRLDKGSYPAQLSDLVTPTAPPLPVDPFTGKGLNYVRHGESFLLYSVGVNGVDEQGRDEAGPDENPKVKHDDIRFGTMPAAAAP